MSKSQSRSKSRLALAGVATGGMTALLLTATAVPAMAVPATLSASSGPSGGGNVVTITAASTTAVPSPFPAGVTPAVQFQAITASVTACSTSWKAPVAIAAAATTPFATTAGVVGVDPDTVKRLNANKLVITVPNTFYSVATNTINTTGLALVGSQTSSKWNLCVYDGTSTTTSALLANTSYSIARQPKINAFANDATVEDGISPVGGPALGGTTITIVGSGFTTGSTVTVGGTPATGVTVNTAGTIVTAVSPPHTAGADLPIIVTTLGGSVSSADPDADADTTGDELGFTYSDGIIVSPNTAPEGATVDLDILGVGFSTLDFDDDPTASGKASVILRDNADWDANLTRGYAACTDYLVISDTEVICTMDLTALLDLATGLADAGGDVEPGVYTVTVIKDNAVGADDDIADPTEITSGATFTVGEY